MCKRKLLLFLPVKEYMLHIPCCFYVLMWHPVRAHLTVHRCNLQSCSNIYVYMQPSDAGTSCGSKSTFCARGFVLCCADCTVQLCSYTEVLHYLQVVHCVAVAPVFSTSVRNKYLLYFTAGACYCVAECNYHKHQNYKYQNSSIYKKYMLNC